MSRAHGLGMSIVVGCALAAACRAPDDAARLTAGELEQRAALEDRDPALRDRAEEHRRQAANLWEEEARRCAGFTVEAREKDPLDPRSVADIRDVVRLVHYGRVVTARSLGADVEVRAEPGVTRAWLSRAVRCHAARHATTLLPDRATDPLAVGRPVLSVAEAESGFVVSIHSDDDRQGREIARRAHALDARSERRF